MKQRCVSTEFLVQDVLLTLLSTATNATLSPLLLLPSEIRCRIYDYVFTVGDIHMFGIKDSDVRTFTKTITTCNLSVCFCPRIHERKPVVLLNPSHPTQHEPTYAERHVGCWLQKSRQPLHQHLQLDLLKVCRQIYHEAVLKPFSQNTFVEDSYYGAGRNSMELLVPAQARAIARLRLVGSNCLLDRASVRVLKGLKHLEILWETSEWSKNYVATTAFGVEYFTQGYLLKRLQSFLALPGVVELGSLRLESLRISVEAECVSPQDAYPYTTSVVEFLKRTETHGLGPAVMQS